MAAVTPARPASGLALTSTWNGLPVWSWVGIGGVSVGAVYIFASRYRKAKAATAAPAGGATGPTTDYPLIIPLPGPPGQSITGATGATGSTGAAGAPGATGAPGAPGTPVPVPSAPPAPPPVYQPIRLPTLQPAPAPAPEPIPTVIVQRGDSLWKIAQRVYGNGALWPKIYAWNRDIIGDNPGLIQPGWELGTPP